MSLGAKVGYAAACVTSVIVIGVAGYAHEVFGLTSSLGGGATLGNGPSSGPMNILVMGLESRTNFQGQNLDAHQLNETHSGNTANVAAGLEGSQDTDTLILVHIANGAQKAVGYSIPRDDVVNYPHEVFPNGTSSAGLTEGKIDAAYAYAYNQSLSQTVNSSISSAQKYQEANQAGQLFEVQTVESVTGVHIDHLLVSNIIGFYELSQQLGGLEICIQPAPAQGGLPAGANLTDKDPLTGTDNSGFDAITDGYNTSKGGKQYLHLDAAQSLAYVRSRDTLPGVDIGRTARQQAAIDYILYHLKTGGVLNDAGQITSLLSAAKSFIMFDAGWNLLDFAQDAKALSGNHLHFTTLPEISTNDVDIPGYPGAQSADLIDVPQIQQAVAEAFYGSRSVTPSTASQVTVDVYNGSGTAGLAGEVSQDLTGMGYKAGTTGNASSSQPAQAQTQVLYGSGSAAQANAQTIANVMGVQSATSQSSVPAGHVEVVLGSSVTAQAPGLEMFGADTVSPTDYVTAAQQNGQSLPPGAQAAANAGTSSDVPAYGSSSSGSSSSGSSSSGSSAASGAASGTGAGSTAAVSAVSAVSLSGAASADTSRSTADQVVSRAAKSAEEGSAGSASDTAASASASGGQYGISGCPY
jgi:anionic cell wall polymer biosynthesis LytR-Cps2A-Psr (LCP) family protein